MIKIKRIYEKPERTDGFRVLVDRLWPRGLSKEKAGIDLWLKEIAPSDSLRKWFAHDPAKWEEFRIRYKAELKTRRGPLEELRKKVEEEETVTLLFGAADTQRNNAEVLREVLS